MTRERVMEIVRKGGNVDYECGREAAADVIRTGKVELYRNNPNLVAVFGDDWVNGFFNYLDAWESIHCIRKGGRVCRIL